MEMRGMLGAQGCFLWGGLGFKVSLCARPLDQLKGMNCGICFLHFPLLPVCPVRLNPSMGLLWPQRAAARHALMTKTDSTRAQHKKNKKITAAIQFCQQSFVDF